MTRPISEEFKAAMTLVIQGEVPYHAAKAAGIHLTTMYKSPVYKAHRDGLSHPILEEIKRSLRKKKLTKRKNASKL